MAKTIELVECSKSGLRSKNITYKVLAFSSKAQEGFNQ